MTERERRQRRLLHVRTLQADLAAAGLRLLRSEHDEDTQQLQSLEQRMHTVVPANGDSWLVACAERELAALHAGRLLHQIEERLPRMQAEAAEEQRRRQEREQVQRLCDRTAILTQQLRERADQATLDDLYSAVRSRLAAAPLSGSRSGNAES